MLNALLVAPVSPVAAAFSLYPTPTRLMLKFENVATPATALSAVVPPSAAAGVPVFGVMVTVTVPVNDVAVFPNASRAVTTTAGVMGWLADVLLGWPVNTSTLAVAGVTVTVAVCVRVIPFAVAVTVFVSAIVELKVLEVWPLVPVALGGGSVLAVPDAVKVTVAPLTRFPNASFTVTVSVAALEPELAVMVEGFAIRVD
jgi:hypothetical protein